MWSRVSSTRLAARIQVETVWRQSGLWVRIPDLHRMRIQGPVWRAPMIPKLSSQENFFDVFLKSQKNSYQLQCRIIFDSTLYICLKVLKRTSLSNLLHLHLLMTMVLCRTTTVLCYIWWRIFFVLQALDLLVPLGMSLVFERLTGSAIFVQLLT